MKKTIAVGMAATALVLTMGVSFASAGDSMNPPANGVTVFSPVPDRSIAKVTADSTPAYNGITDFGSPAVAPASKSADREQADTRGEKQSYNGITVFDNKS
jgi:hypothetical protein